MPLEDDEGLPLAEIYGPVLIEQDLTATRKTRRPDEEFGNKSLDSIKDVFYIGDKFARRIFLRGEAGYGKTVFCLKIIDTWSKSKMLGQSRNPKQYISSDKYRMLVGSNNINKSKCDYAKCDSDTGREGKDNDDNDLLRCLATFDLAFYVPLRYAKNEASSIIDLVCVSVSECDKNAKQKIKQMLGNGSIPCLVILDGLDEWRAPETCRVRGFPDSDNLVNCVVFCTMRPWRMISLQMRLDSTSDKVVKILGLKAASIKSVISNVLVHFYGLKISSPLYRQKFEDFCSKAKLPELQSLLVIPLMLTASCIVWNEDAELWNDKSAVSSSREKTVLSEKDANDQSDFDSDSSSNSEEGGVLSYRKTAQNASYFMSCFYLKLMELTITRAESKHSTVSTFLCDKRHNPSIPLNIPSLLLGFDSIIDFLEIIKPVGRLALHDLVSEEPHLVFPKNKLEREIGQSTVELALKAGILSQAKAPGFSYQQRVSVSFFHKSMQEFIAALYITCGDTEALSLCCTNCNTVDRVCELSNMIKFVFGLDPMVGCKLSKHVNDVINGDVDIIQYRREQIAEGDGDEGRQKIEEMYANQCEWFNEMKHNQSYTHNTDHIPTLHVSDIQLAAYDYEDISVASELVSIVDNSIVSVCLETQKQVHIIIQKLPGCKHLTTLQIDKITTDKQDMKLLAGVLPQLVNLRHIKYRHKYRCIERVDATAVVRATGQLPILKSMELVGITLTEVVTLAPKLETLVLWRVRPSHFILPSLRQWNLLKYIELHIMELTDTVYLKPASSLETIVLEHSSFVHFILPPLCQYSQLNHLTIVNTKLTNTMTLPSSVKTVKLSSIQNAFYILPSISQCNHLKCLCLSNITVADTVILPPLCETVQLKKVKSVRYILSSLPGCINLKSLDIELCEDNAEHNCEMNDLWYEACGEYFFSKEDCEKELDCEVLASILPQLIHLESIGLKLSKSGVDADRVAVVDALCHLTEIKHIELHGVDVGDDSTLPVTSQMTQLETMELEDVKMSARRWAEFVSNLLNMHQSVSVKIEMTNIDLDTVDTIRKSPQFTATVPDSDYWRWIPGLTLVYISDIYIKSMTFSKM